MAEKAEKKAPAKKADAATTEAKRPGVPKVHHLRPVPGANTAFVAGTGGIMSEQVALVLGGD